MDNQSKTVADWAIAHVVRDMAARGMDGNSLTECFMGIGLLRKAAAFEAAIGSNAGLTTGRLHTEMQHTGEAGIMTHMLPAVCVPCNRTCNCPTFGFGMDNLTHNILALLTCRDE